MYNTQAMYNLLTMPYKEGKVFKNFYNLPAELRMMVVDEMTPEDRGTFCGSSKLSYAEAKNSKNYIHGLELQIESEDQIRLTVEHGDFEVYGETGYCMEFRNQNGRSYMKYVINGSKELWRIDLDHSKNLVQIAVEHFEEILERHQKSVRNLIIDTRNVDYEININAGIRRLSRLEELSVMGNCKVSKILSKIPLPLKVLQMETKRNEEIPEHLIYETQNMLNIEDLTLNNAQFLQLAASNVAIRIGDLTETDIFNFIDSWANGKIRKDLSWCLWDLEGSKFDKIKLFALFRHFDFDADDFDIEVTIKHRTEARKQAVLGCLGNTLQVRFEDGSSN